MDLFSKNWNVKESNNCSKNGGKKRMQSYLLYYCIAIHYLYNLVYLELDNLF